MTLVDDGEAIDTDLAEKRIAEAITERLKAAVELAGGPAAVARRSGVPFGSLTKYLAGRQMRPATLVMLSEATNRSVQWLATGTDPGGATGAPTAAPHAPPLPPPPSALLSDRVNLERLVHAYRAARQVTDKDEELVQLMLRFHDVLAAQDERGNPASTHGNQSVQAVVKTP